MRKAVITVAPTGEGATRKDNPALPVTPREIAQAVYESWQAGASVAHIHVRDDNEKPSMSLDKFCETFNMIREKCDIVINLTTSGDIRAGDEERMAHLLKLRPEMASFDCGTMNWANDDIFMNHPRFLEKLARVMLDCSIKPEVEIFDTGMLTNAQYYIKQNLLQEPVHYQFVMGVAGGIPASIENLTWLVRQLPENATWSAFGVGRYHIPIMVTALLLGGDVRVGFEDNIYYSKGVLAKSNAQLVERAVRLAHEFGRETASPQEVREMFQLRNPV